MKKWMIVSCILGAFLLGGIATQASEFYYRDDGDYTILTEVPLPDYLVTWFDSLPQIVSITQHGEGHAIVVDADQFADEQAAREYINDIEYRVVHAKRMSSFVPVAQAIPECKYDYGTNQVVGIYWFNGAPIAVQADPKC